MLELLISQLLRGQGESFSDVQSLLRLLGPLGGPLLQASGVEATTQGGVTNGGLQSALRIAGGGGGALAVAGLVRSLFGGGSTATATVPALRLPRYAAPSGYFEEYGYQRSQGVQTVVRQDEFGRSEVQGANHVTTSSTETSNVALDGRMLLQYSDEIAQAVRQALLYSHPLNELISE